MTLNASIRRSEQGFQVIPYVDFRCPACGYRLCDVADNTFVRIKCGRCKAIWRLENKQYEMIKPPEKITGDMVQKDRSEIVSIMAGEALKQGKI